MSDHDPHNPKATRGARYVCTECGIEQDHPKASVLWYDDGRPLGWSSERCPDQTCLKPMRPKPLEDQLALRLAAMPDGDH